MTRYTAKTLDGIYEILRGLDGPVALFDFFSGEMGHESMYGFACALKFHGDHRDTRRVVALTWKDCGILYQPVSDVQIELDDVDVATMDSVKHRGEGRWSWLMDQGHVEAVDALPNITARFGPAFWQGGKGWWLQGCVESKGYLEANGYKTNWDGSLRFIHDRWQQERFTFDAGPRRFERPYLALFDRNDILKTFRNTLDCHFEFARELADENGLDLVVYKGWYARPSPVEAVELYSKHRDLWTFVNVVQNCELFLSPPSGASELAMLVGCDHVQLRPYKQHPLLADFWLTKRGWRYFGVLEGELDEALMAEVRQFVREKRERTIAAG